MEATSTLKVVVSETLRQFYLEESGSLFMDNGEIWTTNFDCPRLGRLIDYVKTDEELEDGKFFGVEPVVKLVGDGQLDNYRSDITIIQESNDDDDDSEVTKSEVKQRLIYILQEAIKRGASDVHIEVYEKNTKIFSRVDGKRVPIGNVIPEANYGKEIFSVIFLDIAKDKLSDFNINSPNAGRVDAILEQNGVSKNTIWRASYIPQRDGGGKVSLRWLNKYETIPALKDLGYTQGQYEQMINFIRRSKGVMLLSGVTNSGKSTLIAALIEESKRLFPWRSHHTLEDPPEFNLGVIQTHVQPNQKVSEDSTEYRDYNYYSKVLLRQDPDVVVIGEIREHAVAMETCRLGDSGQLVMATLHTSSALGIGETVISQFKVDPAVLSTPDLMCIWATQTLVTTLCPNCKIKHEEAKEKYIEQNLHSEYERGIKVFKNNGIDPNNADMSSIYWRNPEGCQNCNGGEKGLTSLIELLVFDDEDRKFLVKEDYLGWHQSLKKRGFKELKDHALFKINKGILDVNTATDRVPTLLKAESTAVYESILD